jgi:hypothetical protein
VKASRRRKRTSLLKSLLRSLALASNLNLTENPEGICLRVFYISNHAGSNDTELTTQWSIEYRQAVHELSAGTAGKKEEGICLPLFYLVEKQVLKLDEKKSYSKKKY